LLQEIEATPKEYWTKLFDTLHQFRKNLPECTSTITKEEQVKKNQAAIDLMNSWIENDDAEEHQKAWEFLAAALDEDHSQNRPLSQKID